MPTPKLKAFAGDSRGRKIPSAGHTRYAQHPQQRTSSTSRPVAEAFSFRRQRSGRGDQGHLQRRQTGIPEETPSLQAGPFPESRKARAVTRASAPDSDRHRAQAAGRVTVAAIRDATDGSCRCGVQGSNAHGNRTALATNATTRTIFWIFGGSVATRFCPRLAVVHFQNPVCFTWFNPAGHRTSCLPFTADVWM